MTTIRTQFGALKKSIGVAATIAVAGALSIATATGGSQSATAADVSFAGKRITILVPFNPGGGTDSYVRFLAPLYEKHLPGNPKVLVLNKSGAGGILGANYFQQKAAKDGTWVLALSTSTLSNYSLGDPRIIFDLKKYIPVLLSPRGAMQYVRKELGVQNATDIGTKIKKMQSYKKDQLIYGGKTPTSMGLNFRVAFTMLGIEVKNVMGLKGNGPMALAFERGELNVNFDSSLSYKNNRKKLIADGIAVPLYTFGVIDDQTGKFVRDPTFPDVPTFHEAYKATHGKEPSGPEYEAFETLFHMSVTMSKSLNLPPGTPDNVVTAWVNATRAILKDPTFVEKRQKRLGAYKQTIGKAAIPIRDKATNVSPAARKWLTGYLKSRFNYDLRE